MPREQLVRLIIWTMMYYGSDAMDRKYPGSKLRSQAEHIADVLNEVLLAEELLANLKHVRPALTFKNEDIDLDKAFPLLPPEC